MEELRNKVLALENQVRSLKEDNRLLHLHVEMQAEKIKWQGQKKRFLYKALDTWRQLYEPEDSLLDNREIEQIAPPPARPPTPPRVTYLNTYQ